MFVVPRAVTRRFAVDRREVYRRHGVGRRHSLLLMPALCAVLLLSACAAPIPKADPSEAWIGLKEEAPNDLMAERVDGKRVDDGRFLR